MYEYDNVNVIVGSTPSALPTTVTINTALPHFAPLSCTQSTFYPQNGEGTYVVGFNVSAYYQSYLYIIFQLNCLPRTLPHSLKWHQSNHALARSLLMSSPLLAANR
jgi:hypothetical protein